MSGFNPVYPVLIHCDQATQNDWSKELGQNEGIGQSKKRLTANKNMPTILWSDCFILPKFQKTWPPIARTVCPLSIWVVRLVRSLFCRWWGLCAWVFTQTWRGSWEFLSKVRVSYVCGAELFEEARTVRTICPGGLAFCVFQHGPQMRERCSNFGITPRGPTNYSCKNTNMQK